PVGSDRRRGGPGKYADSQASQYLLHEGRAATFVVLVVVGDLEDPALALRRWWGASVGVVWRWRRSLEVTKINNPGTHRLVEAAAATGGLRPGGGRAAGRRMRPPCRAGAGR